MNTNPISLYSKKQTNVATVECIKKALQVKNILYELFGKTETIDI